MFTFRHHRRSVALALACSGIRLYVTTLGLSTQCSLILAHHISSEACTRPRASVPAHPVSLVGSFRSSAAPSFSHFGPRFLFVFCATQTGSPSVLVLGAERLAPVPSAQDSSVRPPLLGSPRIGPPRIDPSARIPLAWTPSARTPLHRRPRVGPPLTWAPSAWPPSGRPLSAQSLGSAHSHRPPRLGIFTPAPY